VVGVTQPAQQPTQLVERATTQAATSAALADQLVVLQRRQQEAVAVARALCHRSQLQRARRQVDQRRQDHNPGPLAWFAVEGVLDDQVVRGDLGRWAAVL